MEYRTKSAEETQKIARRFAAQLNREQKTKNKERGVVIALTGDLGSGKTTFVQGLAKALGITQRIISPTFVLMRRYPLENEIVYHLDMYRLEGNYKEEIENFGLPELFQTPGNIILIEWAEKIRDFLPDNTQWIWFEYIDNDNRKITFEGKNF